MSAEVQILFYCLLFAVAFLYASVGHGGASGYLALMVLFSFTPAVMRPTALALNIIVSLIAFVQYYRNGYFQWSLFWPFALASIPAAFLGGSIVLETMVYKKALGILLIFPTLHIAGVFKPKQTDHIHQTIPLAGALIAGAAIGFISGAIGIGGGILLSPLILLLNWADMKQTAAVSALFILVNSLSGLSSIMAEGSSFDTRMAAMSVVAVCGSFVGAYLGAGKFNPALLKRILAVVLLIASYKLLIV